MKILLIAIVLAASPATAQDAVPRFDPEARCARLFPNSAQMSNFCLSQEQEEYDALKTEWATYSDAALTYCTRLFDESYQMLRFCLQQETAAEGSRKPFNF